MSSVASLIASLEDLRSRVLEHPIYRSVQNEAQLRHFMEQHCFAVWDFMSLLKYLQRRLTSVDLPWRPVGDSESRRLINEIVLGEESDEDGRGGYSSHFELYVAAMRDCGADTTRLERFLACIERGDTVMQALADAPPAAREFVASTWEILKTESLPGVAAAFALGREDLVPKMFHRLVENLREGAPERWGRFFYYLDRHVYLDDEMHGPMAEHLLQSLCGDNLSRWQEAEHTARQALQARLGFWDALMRNECDQEPASLLNKSHEAQSFATTGARKMKTEV